MSKTENIQQIFISFLKDRNLYDRYTRNLGDNKTLKEICENNPPIKYISSAFIWFTTPEEAVIDEFWENVHSTWVRYITKRYYKAFSL